MIFVLNVIRVSFKNIIKETTVSCHPNMQKSNHRIIYVLTQLTNIESTLIKNADNVP